MIHLYVRGTVAVAHRGILIIPGGSGPERSTRLAPQVYEDSYAYDADADADADADDGACA